VTLLAWAAVSIGRSFSKLMGGLLPYCHSMFWPVGSRCATLWVAWVSLRGVEYGKDSGKDISYTILRKCSVC